MTEPSLPELEAERDRLYAQLSTVGDFRRGSVSENYRKCGKPNCACAAADHPGHGPRFLWTRSAGSRRTVGRQLAAAEVEKVRREIARHAEFTATVEQIVEVSERICEARPVARTNAPPVPEGERGALRRARGSQVRRDRAAGGGGGPGAGLRRRARGRRDGAPRRAAEARREHAGAAAVRRPRPARPAAALRPGARGGIH
jgi:hypothetical protein